MARAKKYFKTKDAWMNSWLRDHLRRMKRRESRYYW